MKIPTEITDTILTYSTRLQMSRANIQNFLSAGMMDSYRAAEKQHTQLEQEFRWYLFNVKMVYVHGE